MSLHRVTPIWISSARAPRGQCSPNKFPKANHRSIANLIHHLLLLTATLPNSAKKKPATLPNGHSISKQPFSLKKKCVLNTRSNAINNLFFPQYVVIKKEL